MALTNLVLRSKFECGFDLPALAKVLTNVEYKPKTFNVLIWRHKRLFGTCMVYSSGCIILLNCSSYNKGRRSLRAFARILQRRHGYPISLPSRITIVTSSLHFSLNCRIELSQLRTIFHDHCVYEPEVCNTASLRYDGVHIAVHATGSVLITGVKSILSLNKTVQPVLLKLLAL